MNSPWDDINWTETQYLNWLRSNTRRIWSRHPVKTSYIAYKRFKAPLGRVGKDGKKRSVWACKCEICNSTNKLSNIEVDHIIAGGSFKTWEEYTQWAKRILWVTFNDLRILCKSCHGIVTYSQRQGISFEEAKLAKIIIDKMKKPVKVQKQELIKAGFEESEISNARKRKKAYYRLLGMEVNHE